MYDIIFYDKNYGGNMAKITKETEKTFEENLKYIGLNLNKIPTFLKNTKDLILDLLNHTTKQYIKCTNM